MREARYLYMINQSDSKKISSNYKTLFDLVTQDDLKTLNEEILKIQKEGKDDFKQIIQKLVYFSVWKGKTQIFDHLTKNFEGYDLVHGPTGSSAFFNAIASDQVEMAKHLLKTKSDICNLDEEYTGLNAVQWAISKNSIHMLEYLLTTFPDKFNLQQRTKKGTSPLQLATLNNRTNMIDHLLKNHSSECGLNAGQTQNDLLTFFYTLLSRNTSVKTADHILTNYPGKWLSEIAQAQSVPIEFRIVKEGDIEKFDLFFGRYSNKFNLNATDKEGDSLIMPGLANKQNQLCKHILENYSYDINKSNPKGDGNLGTVIAVHNIEGLSLILKHGIYIDSLSQKTKVIVDSALNYVESRNQLGMAEKLLKITKDNKIDEAAERGFEAALRILGTGINGRSKEDGNTPLHWAILNGNHEWARKLIEKGAASSVDIKNKYGYTPLDLARDKTNPNFNPYILGLLLTEKIKIFKGQTQVSKPSAIDIKMQQDVKTTADSMEEERDKILQEAIDNINSLKDLEVDGKTSAIQAEARKNKENLCYSLGMLLSSRLDEDNPNDSAWFNPLEAYQLLSNVNESNEKYQKAQERMFKLLMSGYVKLAESSKKGLDEDSVVMETGMTSPISLNQTLSPEQELARKKQMEKECEHLEASGNLSILKFWLRSYVGMVEPIIGESSPSLFKMVDKMQQENDARKEQEAALKQSLEKRNNELAERDKKLSEQDKKLADQNKEIEALKRKLASLETSPESSSGAKPQASILSQFQSGTSSSTTAATAPTLPTPEITAPTPTAAPPENTQTDKKPPSSPSS